MNIKSHFVHLGLLAITIVTTFLVTASSMSLRVPAGLWLSFFAVGIPLFLIFNKKKFDLTNLIIFSVGLSFTFIMLAGAVFSLSRGFSGVEKPLTFLPILFGIGTFSLGATAISSYFNRKKIYTFQLPDLWSFLGLPLFVLPLLSAIGAYQLNAQLNTNLSFYVLCTLPFIAIPLVIFHKYKAIQDIIPLYIYAFSLSLIFALSLRSWHISGFDISTEYRVFTLTQNAGYWDMNMFKNAYNACLSITVLPTVIAVLTNIPSELIYKIIFPFILALIPIVIYKMANILFNPLAGFISAFFFISFPWFVDPLTTLARQQIAFFYFALLIYLIINNTFSNSFRRIAFYLFAFSLVVSHYSTTYITIGMFIIAFGFGVLTEGVIRIPKLGLFIKRLSFPILSNDHIDISLINPIFLIYFCATAYIWFAMVTGTSQNLNDLFKKTWSSFNSTDSSLYSGMINDVKKLFGSHVTTDAYSLYKAQKIKQFTDKFPTLAIPIQRTEIQPRSPFINQINNMQVFRTVQSIFRYLSLFFALLSPIAGVIVILGFKVKELNKQQSLSLLWISIYIMVATILIVPSISLSYNFERIFMQSMLLTAISPIVIVFFIKRFTRLFYIPYAFFLVTISIFYAYNYGLVWQVVGGKPVMWLNNKGISYDLTYTHSAEVAAAQFLAKKGSTENIHTSSKGRNILTAYGKYKSLNTDTLSLVVIPGSYIFAHNVNVTQKMDYFNWAGTQTAFTYQDTDFDKRFNVVYSNQSARIYK